MEITKIVQQKKNKERYSLYNQNHFIVGVYEATLIRFSLYKGMSLDDTQLRAIKEYDFFESLYQKALTYLSHGLKTENEVTQYLRNKIPTDQEATKEEQLESIALAEPIIENVIHKLKEQQYVDDAYYAKSFTRTALVVSHKGPNIISRALKQKGVSNNAITYGLSTISDEEWYEQASMLSEKFFEKNKKLPEKLLKMKGQQLLMSKGYDLDIIQSIWSQRHVEEDADLIEKQRAYFTKQANTLLKKYQKQYDGFELKQKLKAALSRKGFDMDDISNWIEEQSI